MAPETNAKFAAALEKPALSRFRRTGTEPAFGSRGVRSPGSNRKAACLVEAGSRNYLSHSCFNLVWESIMDNLVRKLKILHTSLIDARSGYEEGVKDSHGKGVAPLFSELSTIHGQNASVIAQQLKRLGAPVDEHGSWMGTFDRAVMKITSLITELDEKVIPSLINGEQRVLVHYDAAIDASSQANPEYSVLVEQSQA
jgi:uncharacterized protein (TIGR02284 family)